jgi:hypothetical protein
MSTSPDCSAVEALRGVERHPLDLLVVAEDGRCDRLADVDVESRPVALAVRRGEAGQARVDPADELTALLDRVERLAGVCVTAMATRSAAANAIFFIIFPLPEVRRCTARKVVSRECKPNLAAWRVAPAVVMRPTFARARRHAEGRGEPSEPFPGRLGIVDQRDPTKRVPRVGRLRVGLGEICARQHLEA